MTRRLLAAVVAVMALAAGCTTTTSGAGTASIAPVRPSTSGPAAPSRSSAPATSDAPTVSPLGSCPAGADFCDDFANASGGWQAENQQHYYANYATYLGGTYRMGERTANAKIELAPVDTTTFAPDGSVQVDVDAVLGKSAPRSSYVGLACWDHLDVRRQEAGFLFFVTATSVDVTLLGGSGATPHTLARSAGSKLVPPYPKPFHLTASCVQARADGGAAARLSLAINGDTVLSTSYAKSVKNYAWSTGPKAGLLVAGKGSDVFYDNFTVSGK